MQSREALRIARAGGSPRAQMKALTCVGLMEVRVAQYDAALQHFEEVLSVAEPIGDVHYEAVALVNESLVLLKLGLFDWAEERLLRGLNRLGPDGHEELRSNIWINQSVIAREQGNYDHSLALIRRAAALYPESHEQQLWIAGNLGHTLFAASRYEETLAELDSIRDEVRRRGDPVRIAELESTRGKALSALGRRLDAIAAIEEALAYSRSGGTAFLTAVILIDLAQVQTAAGLDSESEQSFRQALEIADRIGALALMEESLQGLSRWRTQRGEAGELEHLEQLSEIGQRRAEQESQQRILSLQTLFEAETKAREAETLEGEESARRRLTYALAVVSILLVVVLGQVFGRYRAEARLNDRIRSDHQQLQRLNNELVQANWRELSQLNRVSALGALAATFAHELRQPLTAIITNAQAAQRALPTLVGKTSLVGGAVEDTVQAARRAQEIVRRLWRLLERGTIDKKRLDLSAVVREVEDLIRQEAERDNVILVLDLAPAELPIRGDRIELQQVVLNLVQNGIAASRSNPDGERRLYLRTFRSSHADAALEVEDTGPEVGADVLSRMFEPLFTTKDHGMGMGLALCRTIAEAHGGATAAERNDVRGLTMRLTVPLQGSALGLASEEQGVA